MEIIRNQNVTIAIDRWGIMTWEKALEETDADILLQPTKHGNTFVIALSPNINFSRLSGLTKIRSDGRVAILEGNRLMVDSVQSLMADIYSCLNDNSVEVLQCF